MPIEFRCECGRKLRAPEDAVGRRGRCPACGSTFTVPAPGEVPELLSSAARAHSPPPAPSADEGDISLATPVSPPPRVRVHTSFVSAADTRPKTARDIKPVPVQPLEQGDTGRGYLYWVLLLVLIPLVWSTVHKGVDDDDSVEQRIDHVIEKNPDIAIKLAQLPDDATKEQVLSILPGHKLEGALLPADTMMHWAFALLAGFAFLAAIFLLFPIGHAKPQHLLSIGLFTGTAGILLLLGFQFLALHAAFVIPRGVIGLLWDIVALIGASYRMTQGKHDFIVSFFGFTAGVGFCEEVCKALPIVFKARTTGFTSWRSAMLWGLISGVGFGVSEGITYSHDYYNGISGGDIYLVRFISCVGLHAMWAAAVGITIFRNQDKLQGEMHPLEWVFQLAMIVIVPMALHGLYDTLLTQRHDLYALLIAFVSFGWLAFQIEWAKRQFDQTALA